MPRRPAAALRVPHEGVADVQCLAQRTQRAGGGALRGSHQAQARLGLSPELGTAPERRLCRVPLAAPALDLAELSEAERSVPRGAIKQLLDRFPCIPLGLVERPPDAQHLGAVKATDTREPIDGVALAPAHRRLGPFPGPPPVAGVPAGEDRAAEDRAGRVEIERSGLSEHTRLIDEAQALVDLLHGDHCMCQVDEPEAFESAITEAPARVDHLACGLGRGLHGALAQQHVSGAEPQPSVLSAFLDVFEQARRAGHPAAGDRVVGALPVHVGELERQSRRIAPLVT